MIKLPQCALCRHFNTENPSEQNCTAFPDGIPADILHNRFDHTAPYPGDAGIRFEARDEGRAQRQTRMFAGRALPIVAAEKQTSTGLVTASNHHDAKKQ